MDIYIYVYVYIYIYDISLLYIYHISKYIHGELVNYSVCARVDTNLWHLSKLVVSD